MCARLQTEARALVPSAKQPKRGRDKWHRVPEREGRPEDARGAIVITRARLANGVQVQELDLEVQELDLEVQELDSKRC